MEKTREIFMDDEEATVVVSGEERTRVAPRFDDEETLVARHVVPLGDADAHAHEASRAHAAPDPRTASAAPNAHASARRVPARPSLLALVLCSVLVGGVLGGAGLYLYQRQSGDAQTPTAPAPAAATNSQPDATKAQGETPADASQPAPATATEAAAPTPGAEASDASTDTPNAPESNATNAPDAHDDEGRANPDGNGAAPAREPESVPAVGAPKRGKKGAHDEEGERNTRRANSDASRSPVARAETDEREARRVDTIFYRPRRAARDRARRRTTGDAERLRRIFEGAPE
ncbi:MAG TPA: hypothetical protein VNZ44_19170 [Pyrinomonadaceae bacterium]|nr:hypothetical protein [Pyrinomonadaceae bacterium]